ncbi:hypothetical protein IHV10_20410 [Fictibacillus sp. 5RED26]|uniref:hypothetical protein n=1 Tax=Fictibacillus sp. 5RED26 TaxID=2745876 RepID=UPI0018CD81AF|nr:hypothetical protein [Fictibacillus sp. 5RED26]MBH0158751.1 hypothetical protein [Fictibacillus sp. 5RED26]
MRISNLIMQGLIAGAVLFIPAEAFAEKEDVEKRNQNAERNNQQIVQQAKATDRVPVQATKPVGTALKTNPSESKDKAELNKPQSKDSEKRSETKLPKQVPFSKQKSSQHANYRSGVKKSDPKRQTKELVPMKQTEKLNQAERSDLKKAELSSAIHRKTVVNKSASIKESVKVLKKNSAPLKENVSQPPMEEDFSPLSNKESSKVPTHLVSKVIPATTGQGSSSSTNHTDGGAGTTSFANFKASLMLPIIFEDGEKVSVYFGRMDLLRSQWVNAPPGRPPESAL